MADYPEHLAEDLRPLWSEIRSQLADDAPPAAIEAATQQLALMRDAGERIRGEGAIVVDSKGNPVEHPAIKIQREATRELGALLAAHRRLEI